MLKLGVLPVKAMLAVEEHLWAASGGQVFIISAHTHCVEVGGPTDGTQSDEAEEGKSSLFFVFFYLFEFNLRSTEELRIQRIKKEFIPS